MGLRLPVPVRCTAMAFSLVLLLATWSSVEALNLREQMNPIRKIVTLLQDMQKEIEADGETEQKAYDKFMCYCDGNTGSMSDSAEESTKMIATLGSKLDALRAEKSQMDQELKGHQESRAAAKVDLKKAATIRAKERGLRRDLHGPGDEHRRDGEGDRGAGEGHGLLHADAEGELLARADRGRALQPGRRLPEAA